MRMLIENETVSLASSEILEASLWLHLRHLNPYAVSIFSKQIYSYKYLSKINYTSKPLLCQASGVRKQWTENSNPIPNSCLPSPVSCLE